MTGEVERLEELTGLPVRDAPRLPGEARPHPPVDCYAVAPASANMVAKQTSGVMDNQALTQVGETMGMLDLPVVVFPRVNAAHARHPAWQRHIDALRAGGVHLEYGPEVSPLYEPREAPAGRRRAGRSALGLLEPTFSAVCAACPSCRAVCSGPGRTPPRRTGLCWSLLHPRERGIDVGAQEHAGDAKPGRARPHRRMQFAPVSSSAIARAAPSCQGENAPNRGIGCESCLVDVTVRSAAHGGWGGAVFRVCCARDRRTSEPATRHGRQPPATIRLGATIAP